MVGGIRETSPANSAPVSSSMVTKRFSCVVRQSLLEWIERHWVGARVLSIHQWLPGVTDVS
jgi:hypothetical protein